FGPPHPSVLLCPRRQPLSVSACFCPKPSRPSFSTLSLHDALPISWASITPGRRSSPLFASLSSSSSGARFHKKKDRREASSRSRSEDHTSELQSLTNLVCRLLLEKQNTPLARRRDCPTALSSVAPP